MENGNIITLDIHGASPQVAFLSDLHWDNPKAYLTLLKKHCDYCLENNIPIFLNGDTFCLMQGKGDRRGNKSDIRPEHNNAFYFDSIVDTSVEWFKPYAHLIFGVGYGNHECYHEDTEVLTERGWINIKEVTTEDNVFAFSKNEIHMEKPNAVVSKNVDKMVLIESSYQRQFVSEKHAVVLDDMTKVNAIDLGAIKELNLPHGRKVKGGQFKQSITPEFIELLTAVVCDATIVDHSKYNPNDTKKRIQFKLSKQRKIEYVKELLDYCGVEYTFKEATKSGVNKLQPYYIRVYGDHARFIFSLLNGVKKLPDSFAFVQGQHFEALIKGLKNTDGHITGNAIEVRTTSKHDADIIQTACILNGWNCSIKELSKDASGFANGKQQYLLRIVENIVNNRTVKKEVFDTPQKVYCLNMPSGNFITRYKGKVAFSGNTSIIKFHETDILKRWVDKMNLTYGSKIQLGGYGGWIVVRHHYRKTGDQFVTYKAKYFHGSGGGGIVTRGEINLTRSLEMYEDFDLFVMGHIHENKATNVARDYLHWDTMNKTYKIKHKQIHMMITGTYKEEYGDGAKGWHVERGAPVKVLGGRIATFQTVRSVKEGKEEVLKQIDSNKFPL